MENTELFGFPKIWNFIFVTLWDEIIATPLQFFSTEAVEMKAWRTYIWLKWESTWWLLQLMVSGQLLFVGHGLCRSYTLIANMAHHSVGAWDKLHEKESSQALMFCFDNASSEIVDLIGFILLCVQVAVLLNATRS